MIGGGRMRMKIRTGGSTVTINGRPLLRQQRQHRWRRVIVDGVDQDSQLVDPVNLVVNGNAESVETTSGKVEVSGSAGRVMTMSGDVECGAVTGEVGAMSGDVTRRWSGWRAVRRQRAVYT